MSVANKSTHESGVVDPVAAARFPLMVSLYIPTFLVSEVGNGFVIYSLAYLKRRRRTTIDSYILNLAIADILVTTLSLFNSVEYIKNEWQLGEGMCKIHGQMLEVCYTASVLTLLAISYNRTKIVKDHFTVLNERKHLKRYMALIWLAAFVLTSPLSYAYTVAKRNSRFHCSNTKFDKMSRSIYYLLQAVGLFFIPVVVMIVSQRKITKGLRQHSQVYTANMDGKSDNWKRAMTQEKRIGKFLTWIWVIFVCCFTPMIVLRTINHFMSARINEIWNQIWHSSQLLVILNSAINPFLYYRSTNRDGANASGIAKILCCIRQKDKRIFDCKRQSHKTSQSSHVMNTLTSKNDRTCFVAS